MRPLASVTSDSSTSNLPIEIITSSEAMGSCCTQFQSVRLAPASLVSSPLPATAAAPVPVALVIVLGMSTETS